MHNQLIQAVLYSLLSDRKYMEKVQKAPPEHMGVLGVILF